MPKNSKPKSVTMLGGKNVAPDAPPPEKTTKDEPAEPKKGDQ